MKKIIFLIILSCLPFLVKAQRTQCFKFATSIGTGFGMGEPAVIPFTWQVLGYYTIGKRLWVGAGTGLSIYQKAFIPLFADAKFTIIKPRKFTPYLECGAGYGFVPDKNANGGFYLNPSIGIQYSIGANKQLFFALGYELQKLERLKTQKQPSFTTEFAEKLNHSSVSVKIGCIF